MESFHFLFLGSKSLGVEHLTFPLQLFHSIFTPTPNKSKEMPARPKGGKRAKKKMEKDVNYARELAIKEEGELYGIVMKELGNRMLEIYCLEDKKTRRCHIPRRIK